MLGRPSSRLFSPVGAGLSCVALCAAAGLAGPQAIVTNFTTEANSLVPGQPGVRFFLSTGLLVGNIFQRPRISADGSNWVLVTRRTILTGAGVQDTARDGLVIAGKGTTPLTVVSVERDPWPAFTTGLLNLETRTGIFDIDAAINNAGQVGFVTLTDAATTVNRVMARAELTGPSLTLTSMSIIAREGTASPLTGFNQGNSFQLGGLTADGRALYNTLVMTPEPPGGQKQATFLGGTTLAETVSGALSAPALPQGGFDAPYQVMTVFSGDPVAQGSDDGNNNLIFAQIQTGTDVAVYNGTLVLREAQQLPDDGFFDFPISQINNGRVSSNGLNYIIRGFTLGEGWVFGKRNDAQLKLKTGASVTPGSTEKWLRFLLPPSNVMPAAFTNVGINNAGDFVMTGFTDNADLGRNVVMVQNGTTILLREGDAIDITGDGVAAGDDAIILGFGQDTMTVTNDRWVYFVADVIRPLATIASQAGDGPIIQGQGFFRVKLACGASDIASPGPVAGADGELTADDIIFFISSFTAGNLGVADIAGPGPSVGADGELTADDIILFINRFTAGC